MVPTLVLYTPLIPASSSAIAPQVKAASVSKLIVPVAPATSPSKILLVTVKLLVPIKVILPLLLSSPRPILNWLHTAPVALMVTSKLPAIVTLSLDVGMPVLQVFASFQLPD